MLEIKATGISRKISKNSNENMMSEVVLRKAFNINEKSTQPMTPPKNYSLESSKQSFAPAP